MSLKRQVLKGMYNWKELKRFVFFLNHSDPKIKNSHGQFQTKPFHFTPHTLRCFASLCRMRAGRGRPPPWGCPTAAWCLFLLQISPLPAKQSFPSTPLPFHHVSLSSFFSLRCFFVWIIAKYLCVFILCHAHRHKAWAVSPSSSSDTQIISMQLSCDCASPPSCWFCTLSPSSAMHYVPSFHHVLCPYSNPDLGMLLTSSAHCPVHTPWLVPIQSCHILHPWQPPRTNRRCNFSKQIHVIACLHTFLQYTCIFPHHAHTGLCLLPCFSPRAVWDSWTPRGPLQ